MVSSNSTVYWIVILWSGIGIWSVLFTCTMCLREKRRCISSNIGHRTVKSQDMLPAGLNKSLCLDQSVRLFSMGNVVLQSRIDRDPKNLAKTSSVAFKNMEETRTTGNSFNRSLKTLAVDTLANDIVAALMLKEAFIGIHIKQYIHLVAEGLSKLNSFIQKYIYRAPTTEEFLENVSKALESLKIGSEVITDDLVRIQALDSNPLNAINKVIRLRHKQKHIKNSKAWQMYPNFSEYRAKNYRDDQTTQKFFLRQSDAGDLCYEQNANNQTRRKCFSKVDDWWRPIIHVRDELNYCELWMVFLEELSHNTESIETRSQPIHVGLTSHLLDNSLSNKNLTETLFILSKKYNLFSLRKRTSELVKSVNNNRLKCLNDILKLSSVSKPACFRVNSTAYVEGPYVTMSDVLDCSKMLINENSIVNAVSVISDMKLFIDQDFLADTLRSPDLEHGKGFHFILMSSEWIVLSGAGIQKTISLKGRTPPSYPPANDNADGNPGLPGEEGGRFYALGSSLSGGTIFININGGDGGTGQDGGKSKMMTMACYNSQVSEYRKLFCCHGPGTKFVFWGKDGGRQGNGAKPGQFKFFVFRKEEQTKIEVHQKPGSAGIGGRGKKYSYLKEGYYPGNDLLHQFQYEKNDSLNSERWCYIRRDSLKHVPLPLSEYDEVRFSGRYNAAGTPRPADEIRFGPEKTVPVIRRYRSLSKKHLNFFNVYKNLNFIANIDKSNAVRSLYDTEDLFWEFKDLEEDTKPGYFYGEILKLSYQSLSVRALAKIVKNNGDINGEHVKLLQALSLASRAKLTAIAYPFELILTVNINEFLATEKNNIRDIKSQMHHKSQYPLITRAVSSYNSIVESNFRALGALINKTINMEMDFLEVELGKSLHGLLDKIKELKKNETMNMQILKQTRKKLEDHIILNRVAVFSKSIGEAVGVLWSVGTALSLGIDMTSAFSTRSRKSYSSQPFNVTEALAVGSSISALRFRKSTVFSLKGFQRQLKAVQVKLNEYTEAFPNTFDTISYTSSLPIFENIHNFTLPLNLFPPKDCTLSYKQQLTTERLIRKLQIKVHTAIQADVSEAISVGISGTNIELISNISDVALAILNENAGIFNKLKENSVYTEEIARAIQKTQKQVQSIQNHMFIMQKNIIQEIHNLIIILCNELAGQQSLALMTIRNKMQSAIRDLRLDIQHEFFKGTHLEAYFLRSVQCVRDAAGILIDMFVKLDGYREMSILENTINKTNLHPENYTGNLSNPSLQKATKELLNSIQGDILLKRQSLVEGAFRMWNFPIIDPILCSFENLSSMSQNFLTHESLLRYVQDVENRIDDMIYTVNKSKTSIVDGDKYILNAAFLRSNGLQFFKWENSTWWQFIESIFEGRSTFLYSNHFSGPHLCEVVKFRQISLSFGSVQENVNLEDDLKTILNDYIVSLTHEGRSYYLFANQTFVIKSDKLEFIFSFEVGSDGLPKTRNLVYDKFLSGDITLSPYSMWFIALKPLNPSLGFERLSKFSKKVDMYLEGVGSCVRKVFAVEGNYVSPTCEDSQIM